jgi:hypothetical protein
MSPLERIAAIEQELEVGAGHVSADYCNKPFDSTAERRGMNG